MMVPMWLAKPIMTVKAAAIAGAPQSGSQPSPYIVPAAETGTSASVRLATALLGLFSSRVEPETYTRPAMFTHDDPAEMAKYRLDPINATGGTNLVHLPGRGLDLDIPISYNSLVWLQDKDSSEIVFDPDSSNVSPGFRMGFPVIEAPYYDTDKGVYVFLMVGTDGSRKEFRDSGSFYYDSADSSYGQLFTDDWDEKTAYEDIHMTLTLADGTKMNYAWYGGKFQPNEIKDRNGNYITITYNGSGGVDTVTDTLGRVVSVNYDSGGYPTSITQSWKGTNGSGTSSTHTWASFHYSDSSVSTSFGSTLTKIGPNNLASVKALDKVNLR
jgi:YD repeat-containing protein